MESPRLRLLFLAQLRGLISPDYPCGVRSQIREFLVLRAVSREEESTSLAIDVQFATASWPVLKPEAIVGSLRTAHHLKSMAEGLRTHRSRKQMVSLARSQITAKKNLMEMTTTLKLLKETDFNARMLRILKESPL